MHRWDRSAAIIAIGLKTQSEPPDPIQSCLGISPNQGLSRNLQGNSPSCANASQKTPLASIYNPATNINPYPIVTITT